MHSTPPNDPKTNLFATSSAPSAPEESPWSDRPFVIKLKKQSLTLDRLKPLPATTGRPSSPTRSFVERPPQPLLKSDGILSPLPIAALASDAMAAPLTGVGKVPPTDH